MSQRSISVLTRRLRNNLICKLKRTWIHNWKGSINQWRFVVGLLDLQTLRSTCLLMDVRVIASDGLFIKFDLVLRNRFDSRKVYYLLDGFAEVCLIRIDCFLARSLPSSSCDANQWIVPIELLVYVLRDWPRSLSLILQFTSIQQGRISLQLTLSDREEIYHTMLMLNKFYSEYGSLPFFCYYFFVS